MKITWDSEAEGAYIKLPNRKRRSYGKEISDAVYIDFDKDGEPTGIELLCVTKPEVEDITRRR